MIWTDNAEAAAAAGPMRRDRERHERIRQLADHLASVDNAPATTQAHWLQAREIVMIGRPLPRGLLAIPRDWCIVRFETDADGIERVTPVLFLTEAQYDNFIDTWYREEETDV